MSGCLLVIGRCACAQADRPLHPYLQQEGNQETAPHYPQIPEQAWSFGQSSVHTEELVPTMSEWPAWGWTGRSLPMMREKFEYVANAISKNGNGMSEDYNFGLRVWGQAPKKGFSSLMVGRWSFSPSWVLGALQCSQLASGKRPTILKLSFTDFTGFMFNQMKLLFKYKHIESIELYFIYFSLKWKILSNNGPRYKLYGVELLAFHYHPWFLMAFLVCWNY